MSTASNRYQVSALNEKLRLCPPPVMSNLMSCVESFLANSHLPMAMQTTHKTPDQPRGNYVAETKITEKCWKQGNSDQNVGGGHLIVAFTWMFPQQRGIHVNLRQLWYRQDARTSVARSPFFFNTIHVRHTNDSYCLVAARFIFWRSIHRLLKRLENVVIPSI